MAKNVKAAENKAKDVEAKPRVAYELPEPTLQVVLDYIANSIPRAMTVQQAVNLAATLQRLKKVKEK